MKKLFTLLALVAFCQVVFAETGVYEYYLNTKVGSSPKNHGNYGGGTSFGGSNIGPVTNNTTPLIIDLTGLKTFKNGIGDVTGATIFYRVYKNDAAPAPDYSSQSLGFFANLGGGNQEWQSGTDINLLAAPNMASGTYYVDVYIVASTNEGDRAYGSAASPLRASFLLAVTLNADITFLSAKKQTTDIGIFWQTASEQDNARFQIERSANTVDFSPIGEVKGAGNSKALNNYSFTDLTPLSGINYYRLKAIDYFGKTSVSRIVAVNFSDKNNDKVTVYPNPAGDVLRLDMTASEASNKTIHITDLAGRVLLSQNISVSKGANLLPLTVSSLASGMYLVKMSDTVLRFVKQ
jgi:hypothetical protein